MRLAIILLFSFSTLYCTGQFKPVPKFNKDSLDIFLIITSTQKLSELDVRVRLKRICGIRPTILFGHDELVFPMNIVEFKHYKNKGESIHSKDIIQYVNEKRKDPCVEV